MDKAHCEKINNVSCSFCLAKWLQVTIDLVQGTTHSCHHPKRHIIPLDELETNPSVLHNTPFKKEQRKKMLEGERPEECVYCWNIEDNVGTFHSDRFVKSTDPWALPYLDKVIQTPWDADINPTYLEVMFDNVCNFSCTYCTADISTSIAKEMEAHGPYRVGHHAHRDFDPDWSPRNTPENREKFRKAFWSWFPSLIHDLEVLRITGGEPFLTKDMDTLLEYLTGNEASKNLQLAVNSNLGFSHRHMVKYTSQIRSLLDQGELKSFELYVSADSFGKQAEYIRRGMDYEQFVANMIHCLETFHGQSVVIMVAYNVLSIPGFNQFLRHMVQIKEQYPQLVVDISYVKNPDYLRPHIIDEKWYQQMQADLEYMGQNFSSYETEKFKRVISWITKGVDGDESIQRSRADFFSFIHEYDRRYGFSFIETFPELKSLMEISKKASFELIGIHPPPH